MLSTNTRTLAKVLNIDTEHLPKVNFTGVSTDTRKSISNTLFVALSGENYDAHDYIQQAEQQGAVALIVAKPVNTNLPMLLVKDTQNALAKIACYHLNNIKPKVIAITGSNGKTTVKNLLKNILSLKAPTLATKGNLNNHLGVPLTLLELKPEHQYAVIEMGANHLGEIAYLRDIANPDIAIVTNTGDAHIGEFGGFENLVKAKGEIYSNNSQNIVNTQTSYQGDLSFGMGGDIFASNIDGNTFTLTIKNKSIKIQLQLLGRHNIDNALAASSCAHALGVDIDTIKQGLEVTLAEVGRLELIQTGEMRLINDSYNANPASIKAAINTLGEFTGERVIVLGQMAELGNDSEQLHANIGQIAHANSDAFYSFGDNTKPYQAQHFGSAQTLAEHLSTYHSQATVLFKGSRIAKLEQIIAKITV